MRRRGDLEGAVARLEANLAASPDARGLFLLGETLLTLGDYARGWPLLEFRWLHPDLIGKRAFYDQIDRRLADAYESAGEAMTQGVLLEDAAEGMDAFLQKRPPAWRGR